MEQLTRICARILSVGGLLDVVRTMRSLAAVRSRQAEEALAGARDYAATVARALADVLAVPDGDPDPEPPPAPAGLLVFGSQHGFVGGLNHLILERAGHGLRAGDVLFVIGDRAAAEAAERALPVAWTAAMTTRRDGVPALARRIAHEVDRRFEGGEMARLDALYARAERGGRWTVERRPLLPLDWDALRGGNAAVPPLIQVPRERLLARLAEEYLFAELAHAAMEALAGENAARLAAMSAAADNIERKLEDLRRDERRLRQEAVTNELLEVVTGSEAILAAAAGTPTRSALRAAAGSHQAHDRRRGGDRTDAHHHHHEPHDHAFHGPAPPHHAPES